MLENEFRFYLDHQKELVKKYNHRYIVIVGETVVGDFDSYEEAVHRASEMYDEGTFLVQECTEGEEGYTVTFHSRVAFE